MLSADELRAALPYNPFPTPARSLKDEPAERAAAELRRALGDAEPPTVADLLDAARRSDPLLGAEARFLLPFGQLVTRSWIIAAQPLMTCLILTVVGSYSALAGTTAPFGTANIAVGSVSIAVFGVAMFYPSWVQIGRFKAMGDLRQHQLALLWRYRALADGSEDRKGAADEERPTVPMQPVRLLQHVDGDPACPCPLPRCAGMVGRQLSSLTLGDFVVRGLLLFGFGVHVTQLWTPMISTGVLWSSWWGSLLGALALASILVWAAYNMARQFRIARPVLMELSSRLISRAVALEVGDLLDRYGRSLAAAPDGPGTAGGDAEGDSLYAALDYLLHAWTSGQSVSLLPYSRLQLAPLSLIPAGVMNLAVGACIPFWELAVLPWYLYFTIDTLINYAAANARIEAVEAVLRDGADAARALAIRAADADLRRGGTGDPALRSALEGHAARLETRAGRWAPARFLGVAVTYGTVRALVATLVTVAFALWGMLRGLGVRVVLESYCYS